MVEHDNFVAFEVTSPPIPTNVHTQDSDTSDAQRESGFESTVATLGYPFSS